MVTFGRESYFNFEEIWVGAVTCFPFLLLGVTTGFSTRYISELNEQKIERVNEDSWIGSSGLMFSFIGALLNGYVADKFGRKSMLYLTFASHAIGWLTIAKTPYVIAGRLITSFGNGTASGTFMYAVEIVRPKIRGFLTLNFTVFELLGNLFFYFLGYYESSLTAAFYFCVLSTVLFILVFAMPESPYWYMLKKQKENAIHSLSRLRNDEDAAITAEIEEIERTLEESDNSAATVAVIFQVKWWKNFVLFSIYVVITEMTGFDMITPYAEQFFATVNRTGIDDVFVAVVFVGVAVLGTIIFMVFVDKVKRKPLMEGANFVNFVLLTIAAACVTFSFERSSIVTLCCFAAYSTTVSITCLSLPWTVMNELTPSEYRATLSAARSVEHCIVHLVIVEFFPFCFGRIPVNFIIGTFGIFSLINCVFIEFCLRETKGIILPGNRNSVKCNT